jgi:hypothetical protein
MRLGAGRGASRKMGDVASTDSGDRRAANIQKNLDMFNNMCGGRMEGNQKVGFNRVSDWAAHVQWVLLTKFGIQTKDCQTGQPIPMGSPFQIVFEPGMAKEKGLPEVLFKSPHFFGQFVREFWKVLGSERGNADETNQEKMSLLGSLYPLLDQGDPQALDLVTRVSLFFERLSRPSLAGRTTIAELAQKLGKIIHGSERTSQALTKIKPDPEMDLKATLLLCQKAREINFPFLRPEGRHLTPQSFVTVVPKDVAIQGDPELTGTVATGGTNHGAEQNADQLTGKWWRKQKRARLAQQPPIEADEPPMESNQWMELYGLMEHWGF